jgi:hypothetical protein
VKIQSFKCFGWGGETGQIQRIRAGFLELGLIESETPDFIYSNDEGSHSAAIECKARNPGAKLILNILDIPEFLLPNEYSLENCKKLLSHADAVTSISLHVQKQLIKFFNLNSAVIYQPISNVKKVPKRAQPHPCICVGRKFDKNKHYEIVESLISNGLNPHSIVDVGPEYGGNGHYVGIVDKETLSELYSSADFSFSFGEWEGWNLPVSEAMACGAIPLIHPRLTTREELIPSELFPEYDYDVDKPETIISFMRKNAKNQDLKDRLYNYYVENLKEKTSPVGVAGKILDVVEKCKN